MRLHLGTSNQEQGSPAPVPAREWSERGSGPVRVFSAAIVLTLALGLALALALAGCGQGDMGGQSPSQNEAGARLDDATLLEILQHPDMLMRIEKIAAHLQTIGPEELEQTRTLFESATFDRGDLEYTLFGEWWARFDAPAAQWWAEINMKARHPRVIASIVRAWAKQDPEAAVASGRFMKVQSGAPIYRGELLNAVIVGWFDSGKPGLEDFLHSLVGEDLPMGVDTYARVRVIRDGDRETLEWARIAEGFTEKEQRLMTAAALTVVAGQNPKLAAEYLEIANKDGVDTRTFIQRIASAWADFDHEGAIRWLATLEPGNDRNNGLRRVAGTWARKEPVTLEAYLAETKGQEWLDPVRSLAVKREINISKFRPDWDQIMARVDDVVGEQSRWVLRTWALQRWFAMDEPAANAYLLGDAELPEAFRARSRTASGAVRLQIEKARAAEEEASPLRAGAD